ncbi:site-specific integrase [Hymenobacter gelipurpurascens]|uniref:site-specific integrase n=1 Tax=Hymenobacter gelipurpurascens TaxID=89968 RepID=UPI00112FD299|nr:site-specific integrase [Hymenobacter gelipurpurascens]
MRNHSLVELPFSVSSHVEAGLQGALNTKRCYTADLRSFHDYCKHYHVTHLPAEVTTVAGYVSQMSDRGMKLASIRRHVATIAKLHQLAGKLSPTGHEALQVVLDGIARSGNSRRQLLLWRSLSRPFEPWISRRLPAYGIWPSCC